LKSITADLSLLLTGLIWGTGFIATHYALESGMPTSLTLLFRFTIAAIPLAFILFKRLRKVTRNELIWGSIAGVILFLAFFAQTVGLQYTTPSNNAFLTGVNVIMVPFITWIIFKRRPQVKFFILPFVTFIGIAVLSYSGQGSFNFTKGDVFTLLCAFLFALHISYLDVASKKIDTTLLTFLQMSVASILSLFLFLTVDAKDLPSINYVIGLPAVFYSGILCFSYCTCRK
jgi:drug/metabolite transporter (DMT)-like permease